MLISFDQAINKKETIERIHFSEWWTNWRWLATIELLFDFNERLFIFFL